jgi:hypothetical protein
MLERCAKAVRDAAKQMGREGLKDSDLKAIDDRMQATMRQLARTEPEWRTLPQDMRVSLAAERIMADIKAEAQRSADLKVKQVVIQARAAQEVQGLKAAGGTAEAVAVGRHFVLTDVYQKALAKDAHGELMNLVQAAGDKTGAGLGRRFLMMAFDVDNPVMTRDIVREVFRSADGHTGNEVAKAAARAWLDTIEGLRVRFNAAGGDVGALDYGYVPQPHDQAKVRKLGADGWARATLSLLDRGRYLDERGAQLDDGAMLAMLRKAHESIATDGLNKSQPGEFKGTGKRANRGSEGREIHFKDGDAWAEYMSQFGRGSLYDAMLRHVNGITRDIGLVERYGPDAAATARLLQDLAVRADGTTNSRPVGALQVNPETYWGMISGKTGSPADEGIANVFQTVRNVMVAAKLGGAVISSFSDLGTLAVTAGYNRLPYWQLVRDIGRQGTAEAREFMSTHGMAADSAMQALNRWSGENLGNNWSGHLANSVMRLSLLNAWTDGLKQGFTLSMNAKVGELSRLPWAKVSEFDRVRFERAGITESDWTALNAVPLVQFKGRELLTPQAIKAAGHDSLAARVMGLIDSEADFAVVSPDMRTRAITTMGGQQAGTYGGELARTVTQFKAFPITMFTRHWDRMLEGNMGAEGGPAVANRLLYGGALMATLLGLGALSFQTKQVLQGKDPIEMGPTKTGMRFWARALATGGGLGIAGDVFLVDPNGSYGDAVGTLAKSTLGPAFGSVGELAAKNVIENAWQAAEGKDTHWQAELLNWTKSNTPGASLWWVKPVMEHTFLNAVNENLSPGYLGRVQERARKDWGQSYWWAPRDATPQRAPEFGNVMGR